MNDAALIDERPSRISVPPNQRTMAIVRVPRNSLIGWARLWRRATALVISKNS